jgi:hypothetical protein
VVSSRERETPAPARAADALAYFLMNAFTHLCGTVAATRHSRGSGNPETHSSNGLLVHGESPHGPRLCGDDELSSKLLARHYSSLPLA